MSPDVQPLPSANQEATVNELAQTLEQLESIHQKLFGQAAPAWAPASFLPFPPGVEPIEYARQEARGLAQLVDQLAFAPDPNAWVPPADSFVSEDAYFVRLEIPGVSREDVNVHVVGTECIVRGERKPPKCAEGARPAVLERPFGKFERRFVLPSGARAEGITARCVEGLLELDVPLEAVSLPAEQTVEVA